MLNKRKFNGDTNEKNFKIITDFVFSGKFTPEGNIKINKSNESLFNTISSVTNTYTNNVDELMVPINVMYDNYFQLVKSFVYSSKMECCNFNR
jgi:hypothetical protein